jgi:hypothetical protein
MGAYAGYWALSIRRALVGRFYRNHALWLGVVCIVLEVGRPLDNISTDNVPISLVLNLFLAMSLAVFFAFIDSMVPVVRRSDPLLRSILRWNKVRIALWADLCLATVYLVLSAVDPAPTDSGIGGAIGFPLFLLPFIVGAPALLIGAGRSRDPVLRASLKWFGGFLLLFLVSALLSFVELEVLGINANDATYSFPALVFVPANVAGAYCLYRSAKSLAPIGRLTAVEQDVSRPAEQVPV